DVLCEVATISKKISQAVVSGVEAEGFNLIQNNGSVAGQVVPHFHWHLIPRHADDGLRKLWPHGEYKKNEIENIANKIKLKL
ncbi:MAG: HIT domain-containing protein, partial [Patescibacteria group bacterium]|nr:HIT domain-containing protein [Patescibacteria group bacterium]